MNLVARCIVQIESILNLLRVNLCLTYCKQARKIQSSPLLFVTNRYLLQIDTIFPTIYHTVSTDNRFISTLRILHRIKFIIIILTLLFPPKILCSFFLENYYAFFISFSFLGISWICLARKINASRNTMGPVIVFGIRACT